MSLPRKEGKQVAVIMVHILQVLGVVRNRCRLTKKFSWFIVKPLEHTYSQIILVTKLVNAIMG
jgi:hypothetical protein